MSSKFSNELFLEACGGGEALQLSVEDASRTEPTRRVFHQPFIVVGRDAKADLILDHWRVSRRHAYLQLVNGRLFCVDLGSRTGTTWDNGAKVAGWLDPSRSIHIGPYEIGRWYGDRPPNPETVRVPGFEVELLGSGSERPRVQINQDLAIVGSAPACRVRISNSDVSKAHCSLLRSPMGVWVVDLLGRGGIFVNEVQVRFARLDDADELRIGRQILRVHLTDSSSGDHPIEERSSDSIDGGGKVPRRTIRRAGPSADFLDAEPAGLPAIPTWTYPEDQVDRVLAERPGSQAELIQALMQPMVQQFGLMQQQMFEQFHHAMMNMLQSFGTFYRDQMDDLREELDEVRRLTQELQQAQDEARRRDTAPPSPPQPPPIRERAPVAPQAPLREEPIVRTKKTGTATNPDVHGILSARIAQLQNERQTRWQKILGMLNRTPQ